MFFWGLGLVWGFVWGLVGLGDFLWHLFEGLGCSCFSHAFEALRGKYNFHLENVYTGAG